MCGQCGDTFPDLDNLHIHMNSDVMTIPTRSGSVTVATHHGQQMVLAGSVPVMVPPGGPSLPPCTMPFTIREVQLSPSGPIQHVAMPIGAPDPAAVQHITVPVNASMTEGNALQIVAVRSLAPVSVQQRVSTSTLKGARLAAPIPVAAPTSIVKDSDQLSAGDQIKSKVAEMLKNDEGSMVVEINSDQLKDLQLGQMMGDDGLPLQIYIIEGEEEDQAIDEVHGNKLQVSLPAVRSSTLRVAPHAGTSSTLQVLPPAATSILKVSSPAATSSTLQVSSPVTSSILQISPPAATSPILQVSPPATSPILQVLPPATSSILQVSPPATSLQISPPAAISSTLQMTPPVATSSILQVLPPATSSILQVSPPPATSSRAGEHTGHGQQQGDQGQGEPQGNIHHDPNVTPMVLTGSGDIMTSSVLSNTQSDDVTKDNGNGKGSKRQVDVEESDLPASKRRRVQT